MILSAAQSDRFFSLFDSLIDFANVWLGVGEQTVDQDGFCDPEAQTQVADEVWSHPEVIDEFIAVNPEGLPPALLETAASWKNALVDHFPYLTCADGQIELLYEGAVFEPCGITGEISRMLSRECGILECALLPFEGVVTYAAAVREYPIAISANMRAQYNDWFAEAREAGKVITTAAQFLAQAPVLKEQAIAREAKQLIEDTEYDLNPPTDFPGVHRGVLADIAPAERDAAIDRAAARLMDGEGGRASRIVQMLKERCLKGPVRTGLAELAATEKNAVLERCIRQLGATRSSGLNKKKLVESAVNLVSQHPMHLDALLIALAPHEFNVLKSLFDRGGRMTVRVDELESLADFPRPLPLLCYLFNENGQVTCVIPDEINKGLKQLDWEGISRHFQETQLVRQTMEMLVDTRGALLMADAFSEFDRLHPGMMDFDLFQGMALQSSMADAIGYEVFIERDSRTLYAVHWTLLDEMEADGDRIFRGNGVAMGELGLLGNLFSAREGKEPWPLPDALAQMGDYLEWALTLPSAQAFCQFLNENVPDGENDYFFADRIMEEVVEYGSRGVDSGGLVQYLEDQGLAFEDLRHENKMLGLLFTLLNDLPRWDNNGWPPTELHAAMSGAPIFRNSDGSPMKVGRNDPCPCGSGKKYKKCCGR